VKPIQINFSVFLLSSYLINVALGIERNNPEGGLAPAFGKVAHCDVPGKSALHLVYFL
jgi:hypothetical protein